MEHWAPEFRYLRTRRRMPDSVNKRSSVFDRRLRCWRTDEGHTALMEDDERRSIEAVSQPAQPHTPPTWRRHRLVPTRAVCRYRITEIAASTFAPNFFSATSRRSGGQDVHALQHVLCLGSLAAALLASMPESRRDVLSHLRTTANFLSASPMLRAHRKLKREI